MASLQSSPRNGHQRPPHKSHLRPPHKGTVLMLRIVQFMNELRPSNKCRIQQWFFSSYCTNCHVHALSVNAGSDVYEWDVVVPCFLRHATWRAKPGSSTCTGNTGTSASINFRLPWPGWAKLNPAHLSTCYL